MRSPHIYSNCVSPIHQRFVAAAAEEEEQYQDDTETLSTHSETNSFISNTSSFTTSAGGGQDGQGGVTGKGGNVRRSFIPQPKASLSSFAVPIWNNGVVGSEHSSNIRVVARIRPSFQDGGNDEAVFAIHSDENNDPSNYSTMNEHNNTNLKQNYTTLNSNHNNNTPSSPIRFMKSPPPGSSQSENVADIAARFNTTPSSPIVPGSLSSQSLPGIITTPTKFIKNKSNGAKFSHNIASPLSSHQKWNDKTPLHTNNITSNTNSNSTGGGSSGLIPSSSMRQSFIQKPGYSNIADGSSSSRQQKLTHQISAGVTDPKYFDFDAVFDQTASQQDVYNKTIGDTIRRNIFRGFNTTVLSYGQTNCGKTYSMYGDNNNSTTLKQMTNEDDMIHENDGIAYRAIHDLFMAKQRHATGGDVLIKATVIEVYNDRIIDLLGYKKSSKAGSMSSLGPFSGKALTSIALKSPSHAREVLQNAFKRKKRTRSHTICTLQVTINPAVNRNVTTGKLSYITSVDVVSAKLTLVDLVGSESTGNTVKQMRSESSIINKDLFVLSQCITALAEKSENGGKGVHVPFRDSKLTTLLRGSLGGNCCTVMIACVSPDESALEDSLNTLRYAERTRNITNRVKKNMIKTTALTPAEGAALRRENKVLKSQLVDMTKKYQMLRRGRRIGTLNNFDDDETSFEVQDTALFSPTNSNVVELNDISIQSDKSEAQRWRLKFEKLEKICEDSGLSTSAAKLDEKDEAMLVSHQVEIHELKELLQRLVNSESNDTKSVASGLTFESFDFPDDQSTISGSSMISSIASRSLKSELLQAEYIGRSKMMETEDRKLAARIEEKKMELDEIEKKKILQTSAMKLKLEKAQCSHDQTVSELKQIEHRLHDSIKNLGLEKHKLEDEVKAIETQLQQKETVYAQEMKDHETNLNQIHTIMERLKNQLTLLEDTKKASENEIEKLSETKSLIIQENEEEAKRGRSDLETLKSQLRSLHEEKLALFSEVEDLQNASKLVEGYSLEQMERQKCEEKLAAVEREVELLKGERGALQQEVAALLSNHKKGEEKKKEMEKELSLLRRNDSKNERGRVARPPLPSPVHSRRSLSPSMRNFDRSFDNGLDRSFDASFDGSAMSTISISNIPWDQFHFSGNNNDDFTLFGDDGTNEGVDQDQKSIHSCFSENSSLNTEQIGVRMHAQKLLFWAEKSMARGKRKSTHCFNDEVDKENVNNSRFCSSSTNSVSKRSINGPNLPIAQNQNRCTCHLPGSLFSQKAELTEFFLPVLGMTCKACSKKDRKDNNIDPRDLTSFLRSWQVNFLKSIGVRTAEGLIQGEKRYANDMAKAMKKWRHKKRMKPARTKSCLVALQIWSKVAKSVLQSADSKKKKAERTKRRSSKKNIGSIQNNSFEFPYFENDFFHSDPMFMEVGVKSSKQSIQNDECSFASVSTLGNNLTMNCMDDSLSLMEGEYEI